MCWLNEKYYTCIPCKHKPLIAIANLFVHERHASFPVMFYTLSCFAKVSRGITLGELNNEFLERFSKMSRDKLLLLPKKKY